MTVLGEGGLRFQSRTGDFDGVVYWTFRPAEARDGLLRLGWPFIF